MVYDSICTDSKAQNYVMNELLQTEWRGAPVIDQIRLAISYTTLPYHLHSYQVCELFPYFMDLCIADPNTCLFNQYKDYAFEQALYILSLTDQG